MSATLLFVHGTGVRGQRYAKTLRLIGYKLEEHQIPATLRGCFWGDAVGAQLRADGRSIPQYDDTGGAPLGEADERLALWSVLYTDPWYELRLLRQRRVASSPVFGEEPPSQVLRRAIDKFEPSKELQAELEACDLVDLFWQALTEIRAAPEFEQAITTASAEQLDHRWAIARALIAYASVAAVDGGVPQIDGAVRDALTERLIDELHGYGMAISDVVMSPIKGIARHAVTRKLTRKRGALTDDATPFTGDVLRFLARGEQARDFLRRAVADVGGEVYLLGHSLGGIMCVDMLIRDDFPRVKGLITVGSQAPLLYEIGALPALDYPNPLPHHFPSWLNLYDRRDLLSYVGAEVFDDRVTDIEVDNGQPFMQSHSAYWSNPRVWTAVAAFLQ